MRGVNRIEIMDCISTWRARSWARKEALGRRLSGALLRVPAILFVRTIA